MFCGHECNIEANCQLFGWDKEAQLCHLGQNVSENLGFHLPLEVPIYACEDFFW